MSRYRKPKIIDWVSEDETRCSNYTDVVIISNARGHKIRIPVKIIADIAKKNKLRYYKTEHIDGVWTDVDVITGKPIPQWGEKGYIDDNDFEVKK